jgi:hypothetical protein
MPHLFLALQADSTELLAMLIAAGADVSASMK